MIKTIIWTEPRIYKYQSNFRVLSRFFCDLYLCMTLFAYPTDKVLRSLIRVFFHSKWFPDPPNTESPLVSSAQEHRKQQVRARQVESFSVGRAKYLVGNQAVLIFILFSKYLYQFIEELLRGHGEPRDSERLFPTVRGKTM